MQLSYADVQRLAYANSPRSRVEVAGKLASDYATNSLSVKEKEMAVDILRLLAGDAEVRVREQLSNHLKACDDLPHEVAIMLAHDIEKISVPVLRFSNGLEEEDLIEVIKSSRQLAKLEAVAQRDHVSATVSEALLQIHSDSVATTLIANKGAIINEASLLHTIENMAKHESVIDALMQRGGLPVVCIEKIFMNVSTQMKKRLAKEYQISRHLIEGKLEYAREMTTLGMATRNSGVNVEALVRHMHNQRKLTSSIVIRSLCVGDLRFFECAMSELTDVPLENVGKLMLDAGPNGFMALYRLSPLPPAYYEAVKKLLDMALDATHNGKMRPHDFSKQIIDNIKSNSYDLSIEYMPLLLAIIKGNASELSSIH
ncbi:MAG: DUF2336 domain-containing protein [Alphaproteobacteria bacterium]|nr:DUF2336 domain-containing protein [Alphaproteobacteria bacterium]